MLRNNVFWFYLCVSFSLVKCHSNNESAGNYQGHNTLNPIIHLQLAEENFSFNYDE